jgi:hypothetical protein
VAREDDVIAPARHPYPDRHIDCPEAMESDIKGLIACAQAAGWTFEDVGTARRAAVGAWPRDGRGRGDET